MDKRDTMSDEIGPQDILSDQIGVGTRAGKNRSIVRGLRKSPSAKSSSRNGALLSRLNQLLEWQCVEFAFVQQGATNLEKPHG